VGGIGRRAAKRRSDQRKKQDRRTKARKVHASLDDDENDEYRAAVWTDALEGVDPNAADANVHHQLDGEGDYGQPNDDGDDEYDELEEYEEGRGGTKKGKGGKKRKKGNGGKAAAPNKKKKSAGASASVGGMPKRFLPRTLASILVEEAGREDGSARAFLDAEARIPKRQRQQQRASRRRKFCPVTGLPATYTEPRTGIPYSNLRALEQIRERAPPWMTLATTSGGGGGGASYLEAVKSIRGEEGDD